MDNNTVDLISSGYEWTCPKCDELYHEIEALENVHCLSCDEHFEVNEAHHAYS